MTRRPVTTKPAATAISHARILDEIERSGDRGLTARELAKLLPGRPDAVSVRYALAALWELNDHSGLTQEWVQCPDHKTYHAFQESRFWVAKQKKEGQ